MSERLREIARMGDEGFLLTETETAELARAYIRAVTELASARAQLEQRDEALRTIQAWDCLNPPDASLCADHPWLKRLVDDALAAVPAARTPEGDDG